MVILFTLRSIASEVKPPPPPEEPKTAAQQLTLTEDDDNGENNAVLLASFFSLICVDAADNFEVMFSMGLMSKHATTSALTDDSNRSTSPGHELEYVSIDLQYSCLPSSIFQSSAA